jgi:large subunit ribosomal protein L13
MMKTIFPKSHSHKPQYFLINAEGKTLGRLASEVSKLLRGKKNAFYTPGVDQGNFVAIINASKIVVSGKKVKEKLYFRNSQRPGSLKTETFHQLQERIPTRILEKAIWGMLPKGRLGRQYFQRLYVFRHDKLVLKKNGETSPLEWIPYEIPSKNNI